ncbi:MAG: cation:proton antiporter [Terriglobales bacterium]
MADVTLYRDLAYVFAAALVGGGIARLVRQPLIIGYVIGGILIGPFTPGPTVSDIRTLELLAEVGVILLMYTIGLEFSFAELMRVRWVALLGTPLGVLVSVALGAGLAEVMGWSTRQGTAIGAIVSVSSTMVLTRLLMDQGELRTRHGRVLIGMALVEDLVVVVFTMALPALSPGSNRELADIGWALLRAALILLPVAVLAARFVPRLLARVARTRSSELYLLVSLAIGFLTAAAAQALGLSLAAGAFLAGMVLSGSAYAHETLAHLLPLRDTFVALFFVTLGALIRPSALVGHPAMLLAILLLVIPGKFVARTLAAWLFRTPLSSALLVGVGMAQIGEFSFVLVQVARSANLVGDGTYNAVLAASLLSILVNAAAMRWAPQAIRGASFARASRAFAEAPQPHTSHGHVVLCGYGRIGSLIGTALESANVPFVAVERDPDIAAALRARGIAVTFGDAAHRTVLAAAGVEAAQLVIVALPEAAAAKASIRAIRLLNPTAPILARAHSAQERDRLMAAGASQVVQPEQEASAAMIRYAYEQLRIPRAAARSFIECLLGAERSEFPPSPAETARRPVVEEVVVGEREGAAASLAQQRVRERFGVTVLSLTRHDGEVIVNPPAEMPLEVGDRLRVFGLPTQVRIFAEHMGSPSAAAAPER